MRYLLALILMVLAPLALAADLVARQGGDSVRLTQEPCPIIDTIVGQVPQGARGYLRLARAEFGGQKYTACYAVSGGVAYLWYEDGDAGMIPLQELKPELDV